MGARTHARNISHFEKSWWCKNDPKVHIFFFLKSDILCLMCGNHTKKNFLSLNTKLYNHYELYVLKNNYMKTRIYLSMGSSKLCFGFSWVIDTMGIVHTTCVALTSTLFFFNRRILTQIGKKDQQIHLLT